MSLELFLIGLLTVSTLTGLTTEAIKKILAEHGCNYYANTLAGCVSVVLSILVGTGYLILSETSLNGQIAVYLGALIILSWLAAMVGYDKVVQAIAQIKNN
jgi:hypothetical protein